jgi:signal peptidase I
MHPTWLLIKRIVGLPGEIFEIKNGKIIIDGHIVEDDHGIFVPYPDQNFEY